MCIALRRTAEAQLIAEITDAYHHASCRKVVWTRYDMRSLLHLKERLVGFTPLREFFVTHTLQVSCIELREATGSCRVPSKVFKGKCLQRMH